MPKRKKSKSKKKIKKTTKRKVKKKGLKYKKVVKRNTLSNKKKQNKKESSSVSELIIKTKPEWIKSGLANKAQYLKKYKDSIKNNNAFWKKEGKRITWIKPYKKIKDVKYSKDCLLYTSPSPRDLSTSRMPSSA